MDRALSGKVSSADKGYCVRLKATFDRRGNKDGNARKAGGGQRKRPSS